jgi:hypothetical protein
MVLRAVMYYEVSATASATAYQYTANGDAQHITVYHFAALRRVSSDSDAVVCTYTAKRSAFEKKASAPAVELGACSICTPYRGLS